MTSLCITYLIIDSKKVYKFPYITSLKISDQVDHMTLLLSFLITSKNSYM